MPDLDIRSRCDGLPHRRMPHLRMPPAARCMANGLRSAMARLRAVHTTVSSFPIA